MIIKNRFERILNGSISAESWPPPAIRAGLLLLALLVLVSRLPTFNEAFERDLMTYMMIADGLLHGRPLYADLMEFKPPAIFWTYALFAKLFGVNPLAIFMMGLTCAWLTLWSCYISGRYMAGPVGGFLAATIWTVISGDLLLQANQPNTEVFINACLACAFTLFMGAAPNQKQTGRFIAIGLLFFLASLFKQISLAVTAMLLAIYLGLAPWAAIAAEEKPQENPWAIRVKALKQAAYVVLIIIFGWALAVGYFHWQGHLTAFKESLVDYGRGYAGDIGSNVWGFLSNPLAYYMPSGGSAFYVPLIWLLTVLTAGYFWRDHDWRLGLWLAYFGGSLITIALPGRFFPHYFQLWLPPLAIAGGCLLGRAWLMKRRLAMGLLLAALLPFLGLRLLQYTIPVEQVPFYKYGLGHGPAALESKRIGFWISRHVDPKVVVYQWGAEPGVYFWARRSAPVGILAVPGVFMASPPVSLVRRDTELALQQLKDLRPGLIVANKQMYMLSKQHLMVQWLAENYVEKSPAPELGPIESFLLLVPKGQESSAQ